MKVRSTKKEDANAIARLMHEYDIYENKLDRRVTIESLQKSREEFLRFLKNKAIKYTVLEDNSTIVGVVNWRIGTVAGIKTGLIQNIFIDKSLRGKGYGSLLIKTLFEYFKKKGCKNVGSFVRAKNLKAQKFWKSFGFEFSSQGFHLSKKL